MIKTMIDMSKPHMFYAAGLGLIMLASLAVSNVPFLSFSNYFDWSYRREACAALFLTGSVVGVWAILRHLARAKTPWKIPQSQVAIPYALFFVLTFFAIAIAR